MRLVPALRGGRIDAALHYSRRSAAILAALAAAAGLMPDLERLAPSLPVGGCRGGPAGHGMSRSRPSAREEALLDLLDAPADAVGVATPVPLR